MVDILVGDLTEQQAFRLEAELLSAFGTVESGRLLTSAWTVEYTEAVGSYHRQQVYPSKEACEAYIASTMRQQGGTKPLCPGADVAAVFKFPPHYHPHIEARDPGVIG